MCQKASAIMENYQTTGWKYLEKMEDIFPEGGTTGTQAFCGGATSTLPGTSDAVSHESDHPSIAFMSGSSNVLNVNPQLINNAITSTTTAINSLTPSGSSSLSGLIQSNSTQSSSHKHLVLSLSPDESGTSGNSLLFSPTCHPISTASTTSLQSGSKCSHTSGGQGTTSGSKKNTTTVALHAMDLSICHLEDSITNILINSLKSVQDAMELLYQHGTIPDKYCHFMLLQFTNNPTAAVTYLSLPDDDKCLVFVTDMYEVCNLHRAGLGQ
ncbi:hypothetical protein V8B97DRAFT_2071660 [Scleroderma yunnanense]